MPTFKIEIDCENDIFQQTDPYLEVGDILVRIGHRLLRHDLMDDKGYIIDSSGNTCGQWEYVH